MSHVTSIELNISDLSCLEAAAKELGMELVEKSTFVWYGRHVGDYPLPEGFTKEDMGKCQYVLRIKGKPDAYEVGITKRRDGKPGYVPLFDFWAGGKGLMEAIGANGSKLRQEYALAVAMKDFRKKGFKVTRGVNAVTGKPNMLARRSR